VTHTKLAAVCAILSLVAVSCGVRPARVGERPGPDQLMRDLSEYNGSVRALEGRALVVYREGEKVTSLKASIAADKARTRYRLELYDYVFNRHILSLVRQGDEVHAVLHVRKESLDVSYEEFELRKTTGIAIPKDVLFKSMIGEVYVGGGGTAAQGEAAGSLTIEYPPTEYGLARETVVFDESGVPVEATFLQGDETFTVRFSKHKAWGGQRFPSKISIEGAGRSIEINYTDLELNRELQEQAFEIGKG
jgi:hypothetical protein